MADSRAQIVIGAENRADAVLKSVRAQLGGLAGDAGLVKRAFGGLGTGIAASLTGAGLAAFFKNTADGLDRLNDVADVTGATIENISALEDVGARTGTSIDAIEDALVKLNAQLKEADGKNGVSLALKQIGLDATKLKQLDPAEALRQTAVALAGFADDGDKARLVQELFGKSVRKVGPFLKDLATQGKLVATVTTEQAKEAEKFNQQLLALQKNATDLARSLSGPLITSLNDLSDRYRSTTTAGGGFFSFLGSEYKRITQKQLEILGLAKEVEAAAVPDVSDAQSRRVARGETPQSVGPLKETIKAQKAQVSEAQRYLENLVKQGESYKNLNNYEKALSDIQNKRIDGLTPKLQREILLAAQRADLVGKTLELETRVAEFRRSELASQDGVEKALLESQTKAYEDLRQAGVKAFDDTRTAEEKLFIEIAELDKLLAANVISIETYNRAIGAAFAKRDEEFKAQRKEIDETTKNFVAGTQQVFANTFENLGTGGLKNFEKEFSAMLLRIAAQAAAADLTKRLFGENGQDIEGIGGRISKQLASVDFSSFTEKFSSVLSGIGESIAGLFSSSSSGSVGSSSSLLSLFGSLFAGGFASGGYAPPNKVALVGENGPELRLTGRQGMTILPLMQTAAKQQPINVTQNFMLSGSAPRQTQQQLASAAAAGVARAQARKS